MKNEHFPEMGIPPSSALGCFGLSSDIAGERGADHDARPPHFLFETMSRDITEDLEVDDERAERMEQLFFDVLRLNRPDPVPEELASDLWELRDRVGWKTSR